MATKRDLARRRALSFGCTEDEANFAARLAGSEATHEKISSMVDVLPREVLVQTLAGFVLASTGFDEDEAIELAARLMNNYDRALTVVKGS